MRKKQKRNPVWYEENREKLLQQKRDWYYNNKDKAREQQLRAHRQKKYGISHDQYLDMLEEQDHVCAICKQPEFITNASGTVRPLCVDHCHTTGNVRGLLCNTCNILLSRARDSVDILENAIEYLRRSW